MDRRISRIVLKGLVITFIIVVLIFGYLNVTMKLGGSHVFEDPSAFKLLSLKSEYPYALKLAKEWREDAYLVLAVLSVKPKSSQLSPTIYFRFEAENAPKTYKITIGYDDGERIIKVDEGEYDERLDFPPSPKIDLESILMDSPQAFEFLHLNGGNEFTLKYGDKEFYVTLFLEANSSTRSSWRVRYYLEPGPSWNIIMNAYTNKLLNPKIYGEE